MRAGAASGNNAQGFQYDAVGRLIAVRRGTAGWPVEEELAYDGTQMVAAWNGAGVATWSAVWGQGVDNLISVKPGGDGAEVMALKDGRGSVVGYDQAEATPQGLLATADYTPEGRVTSKDWVTGTTCTETGSTQCPRLGGLPFGFHGAYKSPAHGLLYFRNRWYSAEAGQWLTQDPLGEVDSVNLYAFNRFDSVNFIDPFGLESQGAAITEPPNHVASPTAEDPIEECARTGGNCPSYSPDPNAPRDGSSFGGPVIPPKAADDVDARAYMREEAKDDRRNAGRGGMVADAVVQTVLAQNVRRAPSGQVLPGDAGVPYRFDMSGPRPPNEREREFIERTIAYIERVPGYKKHATDLRRALGAGDIKVHLKGKPGYANTSGANKIVITQFDHPGGFDLTLVHEAKHLDQNLIEFMTSDDDPDNDARGNPGPAYQEQNKYEADRLRQWSVDPAMMNEFNKNKKDGEALMPGRLEATPR